MRIFGARIFSKSFGGKIRNFQTDSNDMEKLKKKKRRLRILSARIFSKFFGGKIRQKIESQKISSFTKNY